MNKSLPEENYNAFPLIKHMDDGSEKVYYGLSRLEYIAALVASGLINKGSGKESVASLAVGLAKEIIKECNKE